MKKIILLIILIVCFVLKCIYVFGHETSDGRDDFVSTITSHIEPNETKSISRGDCIAAILKSIGMEQDAADLLNYYTYYDQPVFLDEYDDIKNRGYIIQAIEADIVVGVKNDLDGRCYFAPNKNTTIKECLTFMLRCVRDYTTVDWNNNIISYSEEVGLLTREEVENVNHDEVLTIDMFNNLLERMLNMNRYLYWQSTDDVRYPGRGKIKVDQTNSIKYIDWIKGKTDNETTGTRDNGDV